MFPEMKSRETTRFSENKIHRSPRDQSLSDLLSRVCYIAKQMGQTGGKQKKSGQHFAGNSELFPV